MDTNQIVSLLTAERDRLNAAISALTGGVKRRGRPRKSDLPDWVTSNKPTSNGAAATPVAAPRKKRTFTAAQRKQAAERMRQMWAKKKKAAKRA